MSTRNRIYLIGFSGAGKSAVGRSTARLLGWRFEDADERIVARAGKPVERIFSEDGEPAFRELERATIAEFAREECIVVSTGAGSVMHDQSLGGMLGSGLVVALEARPETVYRRLSHIVELDGAEAMARPMLQSDDPLGRIESLKRERQWAYARAHWTVHTDDLTIEQAALEVVRAWRRLGAPSAWEDDPDLAATVRLEQGAYPVFVGWDTLEEQLGRRLAHMGFAGRAFIVCDSNVVHPYGRAAQRSLHAAGIEMGMFTFPAGEASKSLATATVLYEWLAERRAERRDVIVAVGGGVVGDLAGYAAATFLRGIRLVQVPTSLTAMVDSSIGGKTGVDLPVAKNMVGAFHHPAMVLADVSALRTLPQRALREGWAEAVKHGLALEAGLVDLYEEHADALLSLDPELTTRAVAWNTAVKARDRERRRAGDERPAATAELRPHDRARHRGRGGLRRLPARRGGRHRHDGRRAARDAGGRDPAGTRGAPGVAHRPVRPAVRLHGRRAGCDPRCDEPRQEDDGGADLLGAAGRRGLVPLASRHRAGACRKRRAGAGRVGLA